MSARWSSPIPLQLPTGLRPDGGVGESRRPVGPPRPGSARWLTAVTCALAVIPAADFLL